MADEQKETILQEAQRLVHGPRGASYGHPIRNYACTAAMLNALWGPNGAGKLQIELTAADVILGMVAVKMSRESRAPGRDNRVDGCGYFECLNMVRELENDPAALMAILQEPLPPTVTLEQNAEDVHIVTFPDTPHEVYVEITVAADKIAGLRVFERQPVLHAES